MAEATERPKLTIAQEKALDEIHKEIQRNELFLDLQRRDKILPQLEARRKVFKSVPNFWPLIFNNHPGISQYLTNKDDINAISYLEDVWVEQKGFEESQKPGASDPRQFSVEFHFRENPYFSDKVLIKTFNVDHKPEGALSSVADANGISDALVDFEFARDYSPQITKIHWIKPEKALTKLYPLKPKDDDEDDDMAPASFFHFFETDAPEFVHPIGFNIVTDLFPDAADYMVDDSIDEDIASEDEDESDGDDSAKPAAKKARKN